MTLEQLKKELIMVRGQLPDFTGIGPVYLVGGSLRDRIINRPSNDYDFAVVGNAGEFAKKVAAKLGVRTIQMGKGYNAVYRVISGDKVLDFSSIQGKTIEDDLKRRDFTVNGLGFNLSFERPPGSRHRVTDGLIDLVGGLNDIKSKTIRLISENAILADPLRMIRAFRLAATLGFEIEPLTLSAIKDQAGLIAESARERIKEELFKMMKADRSFPYVVQMVQTGLLMKLIPELEPCRGCLFNDDGYDVLQHVIQTYEEIETVLSDYHTLWPEYAEPICSYLEQGNRKVLLKWAALLHDLGKPMTRKVEPTGKFRFLGHAEKGAHIAKALCTRFRMSGYEGSYINLIVRNHLHPLHLFESRKRGTLTTRGVVRFSRKYEDDVIGILLHSVADQRAKATGKSPVRNRSSKKGRHKANREIVGTFMAFVKEILQEYLTSLKPKILAPRLVTGKDLIEHFGLKPSKLFAKLLDKVEDARLNQEIRTREDAFKLLARLIELEGDAGIEPATPSSGGLCSIR